MKTNFLNGSLYYHGAKKHLNKLNNTGNAVSYQKLSMRLYFKISLNFSLITIDWGSIEAYVRGSPSFWYFLLKYQKYIIKYKLYFISILMIIPLQKSYFLYNHVLFFIYPNCDNLPSTKEFTWNEILKQIYFVHSLLSNFFYVTRH